jgi:hypothetical protein
MRMLLARLDREAIAGIFVVLTGGLLWLIVAGYPRGQLSEIGPGFVPFVASIGLILVGAAMVARAAFASVAESPPALGRAVLIVPLGMVIFAFGLQPLGLFATSAAAVFVTTLASRGRSFYERVAVAVALAALVTFVFGYGLSMSLPIWPAFLRP